MRLLVLGGTQMIGRDFVETIQNTYPEYTLYIANRGITNSQLFPEIKRIFIDRNKEDSCQILSDYQFDTVIDFSCYDIIQFLNTFKYIKYNRYFLISTTCSIDQNVLNNSNHPYYSYCKNKKNIEEYIHNNYINNISIIRPCILYGKYDYTNRFYEENNKIYWKHNNQEVIESKYYINVNTFTKHLYNAIIDNKIFPIIQIDGDGSTTI